MARLFVTSINLNKNELQNARIQNLSSAPSSPVTGQIYYDSTESKMYYYNGLSSPDGPWMPMSGSAEVIQDVIGSTILDGTGLDKTYDDGAGTFTLSIDSTVTTNSGSQTLTNKSIDLANNTLTGTVSQFNTALSGDNFATLTGSETLTNKTLTSPSVSGLYLSDQSIIFEGLTPNDNETILTVVDPTADRTITLPDATTTLVGQDTVDTLTNKTITSPIVSGLYLSDGNIVVEGSTTDGFETTLSFVDPTSDQTIYVPNASGTIARLEDKLHQFALATASVDLNNQKIINVTDPTNPQDAANKRYVDAAVVGIDWKPSVRLATTAAITLATGLENGDTLDGVVLATGNRVLVKNQSDATENGIYVVAASGAPVRSSDADTAAEITASFAVFVEEGTVNFDSGWVLTNNGSVTVGTTELSFTQFTGLGQIAAGAGLTKTANTLDVIAGLGITVNANDVAIDTSVTARKYAVAIGDGTATSYTVTHSLNNQDVVVQVVTSTGYIQVEADVTRPTNNTVVVAFAVAPTTNEYRVIVIG